MVFLFSQYLPGFPPGTPASTDNPKKIRLIGFNGDFILPIGVNVWCVVVCLYVTAVMNQRLDQDVPCLRPGSVGIGSSPPVMLCRTKWQKMNERINYPHL